MQLVMPLVAGRCDPSNELLYPTISKSIDLHQADESAQGDFQAPLRYFAPSAKKAPMEARAFSLTPANMRPLPALKR
jgi:hypothetical protein